VTINAPVRLEEVQGSVKDMSTIRPSGEGRQVVLEVGRMPEGYRRDRVFVSTIDEGDGQPRWMGRVVVRSPHSREPHVLVLSTEASLTKAVVMATLEDLDRQADDLVARLSDGAVSDEVEADGRQVMCRMDRDGTVDQVVVIDPTRFVLADDASNGWRKSYRCVFVDRDAGPYEYLEGWLETTADMVILPPCQAFAGMDEYRGRVLDAVLETMPDCRHAIEEQATARLSYAA
jgi:hypothetical protein